MKALLIALITAYSFSALAGVANYKCDNRKGSKLQFTISDASLAISSWVIYGEDEANPFDCLYKKSSNGKNTFSCASYQGAPYGYLLLPSEIENNMSVTFLYIDENDFRVIRKFVGTCRSTQ